METLWPEELVSFIPLDFDKAGWSLLGCFELHARSPQHFPATFPAAFCIGTKGASRNNRVAPRVLGLLAGSHSSLTSQYPKCYMHLLGSKQLPQTTWHIKPIQRSRLHKTMFGITIKRQIVYRKLGRRGSSPETVGILRGLRYW